MRNFKLALVLGATKFLGGWHTLAGEGVFVKVETLRRRECSLLVLWCLELGEAEGRTT